MDKKVSGEWESGIELSLQGSGCRIGIGKGVIRALGEPTHVSLRTTDSLEGIVVFPCDEDDVMSFRVPKNIFTDKSCVMRISSKLFVHGVMRLNGLDITKSYGIEGEYLPDKNIAVFSLKDGIKQKN